MNYRIGTGIDYHPLVQDRSLYIGGVKIPHSKGSLGHSDADVLLHAICDAMLGAVSLGDIGQHFPNHDPQYHLIDSKILLRLTFEKITVLGWKIVNVDSMVCLERPKIANYITAMQEVIIDCLHLNKIDQISIKATTTEKMGFIGREEGVMAQATVLLIKPSAMLRIPILNQSPFPAPHYATEGSAGMDLRANIPTAINLQSLERYLLPTGILIAIPAGFEGQVRSRSGLSYKQGITCVNSPGTIDSDYRGEIKIPIINLSTEAQQISPGDRVAQLVIQRVEKIQWEEVTSLDITQRNNGGFGHTGKQ